MARSLRSAGHLGCFLPVLILFLLGGRQAYAGTNQWTGNGSHGDVIRALAIDPINRATLYVGGQGTGVYKSTDSGGSWSAVNTGLPLSAISLAAQTVISRVSSLSRVVSVSISGTEWRVNKCRSE
jgi:hypothetical protein